MVYGLSIQCVSKSQSATVSQSVFGRRFVLLDADLYVLNFLETFADQIPSETLNSLRQRLRPEPKNTQTTGKPCFVLGLNYRLNLLQLMPQLQVSRTRSKA